MNEHFPVLSGSYEKRVEKGEEKKKENPGNRIGFLKKLGRKALPYVAAAGSFFAVSSEANAQKGDKILNDATYTQLKNNEGKVGVQEGDTVHVLKVKQKREGKKTVIKEKGDVKILNTEEKLEQKQVTGNFPGLKIEERKEGVRGQENASLLLFQYGKVVSVDSKGEVMPYNGELTAEDKKQIEVSKKLKQGLCVRKEIKNGQLNYRICNLNGSEYKGGNPFVGN
jgi:hypothetical protein